jgi:hypothetical protein
MNPSHVRTAKSGKAQSVNLDELSRARIAFCSRYLIEHIKTKVSLSTIVRRALEVYTEHCETLLRGDRGKSDMQYLKRLAEGARLDAASKGGSSYLEGMTADLVNASPTLSTLHQLQKEKDKHKPHPFAFMHKYSPLEGSNKSNQPGGQDEETSGYPAI